MSERHPWIELERLSMDTDIQLREETDLDYVRVLAERYMAGVDLPPVVVFRDEESYWLADGFHRVLGAQMAGRCTIDVDLRKGTRREAKLFWLEENLKPRALPFTMRDLEHQARTLLREFPEKRADAIARHMSVSVSLVKRAKNAGAGTTAELFGGAA